MWPCHGVSKGHDFISFLVSTLDFNVCNSVEGLFNRQVCRSEHSLTICTMPCVRDRGAAGREPAYHPSQMTVYLHQDKIQSGYLIEIP
jgi:hypothetical protein